MNNKTDEHFVYSEATQGMSNKAKYKLANWLAHGYVITPDIKLTIITRSGKQLAIDKNGSMYSIEKVHG